MTSTIVKVYEHTTTRTWWSVDMSCGHVGLCLGQTAPQVGRSRRCNTCEMKARQKRARRRR